MRLAAPSFSISSVWVYNAVVNQILSSKAVSLKCDSTGRLFIPLAKGPSTRTNITL